MFLTNVFFGSFGNQTSILVFVESEIFHSISIRTSLEKLLRKSPDICIFYLPTYITYGKILAHVHDHVRRFYGNCRTLEVRLIHAEQIYLCNFIILRKKDSNAGVFLWSMWNFQEQWWLLLKTRNILLRNKKTVEHKLAIFNTVLLLCCIYC